MEMIIFSPIGATRLKNFCRSIYLPGSFNPIHCLNIDNESANYGRLSQEIKDILS